MSKTKLWPYITAISYGTVWLVKVKVITRLRSISSPVEEVKKHSHFHWYWQLDSTPLTSKDINRPSRHWRWPWDFGKLPWDFRRWPRDFGRWQAKKGPLETIYLTKTGKQMTVSCWQLTYVNFQLIITLRSPTSVFRSASISPRHIYDFSFIGALPRIIYNWQWECSLL